MTRTRFILFCLLTAHAAVAQPPDTLRRIDQLFSNLNNATAGASVLVARGEKVLYHKAFGLADLERNIPNTTETIFEGGSLSKQFTATALLLLVADGKLSLDDDVRKYVPEIPDYGKPIRIQYLLNHTSGVKDWGSIGALAGWPRTTRIYTQEMAIDILSKQTSLNFTPNNEYSYSNGGYSLIVTIIERISGKSLADFTKERIFDPLGMKHTRWRNNFREIVPDRANAYGNFRGKISLIMPFEDIYGHGGILTTTGDLLIWNRQLKLRTIGGEKVYAMRIRQGTLNNKRVISYASGIDINTYHGTLEISHSGATAGYRAWLAYYPQKDLTVAILSNSASFNPVARGKEIADLYVGAYTPTAKRTRVAIPISREQQTRFEGVYRSLRGFDVQKISSEGSQLLIGGSAVQASHADTLFRENLTYTLTKPGRLMLDNEWDTTSFALMKPVPTKIDWTLYTGDYTSREADCIYRISVKDNKLWVRAVPPTPILPYALTPVFADGFVTDDQDLFEFKRDKSGKVTGLHVSTERALRIQFTRTPKK